MLSTVIDDAPVLYVCLWAAIAGSLYASDWFLRPAASVFARVVPLNRPEKWRASAQILSCLQDYSAVVQNRRAEPKIVARSEPTGNRDTVIAESAPDKEDGT